MRGREAGQGQAGDGKKNERLNIGAKYIFLKNSIKIPLRKGRDLNINICAFLNATFLRRFEY